VWELKAVLIYHKEDMLDAVAPANTITVKYGLVTNIRFGS